MGPARESAQSETKPLGTQPMMGYGPLMGYAFAGAIRHGPSEDGSHFQKCSRPSTGVSKADQNVEPRDRLLLCEHLERTVACEPSPSCQDSMVPRVGPRRLPGSESDGFFPES